MDSQAVSKENLSAAVLAAQQQKVPLPQYLVQKKLLTEETAASWVAKYYNLPFEPGPLRTNQTVLANFPPFTLRRFKIIPLVKDDKKIRVATSDPGNLLAVDEVRRLSGGLTVELVCTTETAILDGLSHLSDGGGGAVDATNDEKTVAWVDKILSHSIQRRASDIHMEPQATSGLIRERIDGILYEAERLPPENFGPVLSRIKVLAGMDIVEKRISQDGRFRFKTQGEIRASTLPTIHGEKMVLRILPNDKNRPTITGLQLGPDREATLQRLCTTPEGLILVAGPTGSGKTTTLYAMLSAIDRKTQNVITIEDPVEYELESTNQIQINEKIGITFGAMLPTILRQDPDILFVGELRDEKTTQMCLRAAITGHLVFSTVHAPDAVSTLIRLEDMGIAPHLVASCLKATLSQRLLRRLCRHCKRAVEPSASDKKELGISKQGQKVFEAVGCAECHQLGYQGRFAAIEILVIDENIRDLIVRGARKEILSAAQKNGFKTMRDHALEAVLSGETSLSEFLTMSVTY